jgi:CheY-like chemotaxis protein
MTKTGKDNKDSNKAFVQQPLYLLLADDDHDDRLFFSKALKELDTNSYLNTVNDGQELMKLLIDDKKILPDVLFLDINMPCKSGTECLVEIKKVDKLKNLPIVMFSTTKDVNKIKYHFEVGAKVFIHKPNDFEQLKEVIFYTLSIATESLFLKNHTKFILNA